MGIHSSTVWISNCVVIREDGRMTPESDTEKNSKKNFFALSLALADSLVAHSPQLYTQIFLYIFHSTWDSRAWYGENVLEYVPDVIAKLSRSLSSTPSLPWSSDFMQRRSKRFIRDKISPILPTVNWQTDIRRRDSEGPILYPNPMKLRIVDFLSTLLRIPFYASIPFTFVSLYWFFSAPQTSWDRSPRCDCFSHSLLHRVCTRTKRILFLKKKKKNTRNTQRPG